MCITKMQRSTKGDVFGRRLLLPAKQQHEQISHDHVPLFAALCNYVHQQLTYLSISGWWHSLIIGSGIPSSPEDHDLCSIILMHISVRM